MSILSRYRRYKENGGNASPSKVIHVLYSLLLARIYLRKCSRIGKWVSVNGKPLIQNRGQIILHDEVRIWSSIERAKLFTGPNGKLTVGKNSRINGAHISAHKEVTIGENVRIAPYTIILDSDFHDLKDHFAEGAGARVIIENNVWLATRCTILKGVVIGEGAVVAAGAVVTKDVPPYTLVAGVPAKVMRKLN